VSSTLMEAAAVVGRLLLAGLFLHEAWSKLAGYSAALAYMHVFGIPGQLLPLAIAVELSCGLLIAYGYYTRAAALVLAGFCVATAILFHDKLSESAPAFREGPGDRRRAVGAVCPRRGGLGARCVAGEAASRLRRGNAKHITSGLGNS